MSKLDFLRNYRNACIRVKEIARELDSTARIIAFGSVVKGNFIAASDLDILLISERTTLWNLMRARIFKEFLDDPVEIHFATSKEFDLWYRKFMDAYEEI